MSQPQDKRFVIESRVDSLVAAKLRDPISTTRIELLPVVDAAAVKAIAADPNVAAAGATAANAAVGAALGQAGVMSGANNSPASFEPEVSLSFTDQQGNRSWLEANQQGKPTNNTTAILEALLFATKGIYNLNLPFNGFALTDGSGNKAEITLDSSGRLEQWAVDAIVARAKTLPAVPTAKVTAILAAGDSMTYGQEGNGTTWPNVAAALTGIPITNAGFMANGSADIGTRTGGVTPQFTAAGNMIPASGSVTLTNPIPADGWRVSAAAVFTFTGYLCGILGTLSRDLNNQTWSFTRTSAGTATPCPPNSPFRCTQFDANRADALIAWTGRNNANEQAAIIRDTDSMIAHMSAVNARYMVISPTSSGSSTSDRDMVNAIGAAQLAKYGVNYFNLQAWMSSTAAFTAVGATPTTQDTSDIAAGLIPTSFRAADGTHFNDLGYTAAGYGIANKITALGWKG